MERPGELAEPDVERIVMHNPVIYRLLSFILFLTVFASNVSAQECVDFQTLGGRIGLHATGAEDILLADDILYACSADGLTVLDVTDPMNPQLVESLPAVVAHGLARDGDRLYALTTTGISFLDIGDPSHPVPLSEYIAEAEPLSAEAAGGMVYLALGPAGIEVVDATDPLSMTTAARIEDGYHAAAISVDGNLAAVARGIDGWAVYEISNPAAPVLRYDYWIPCYYDENYISCNYYTQALLEGNRLLFGRYTWTQEGVDPIETRKGYLSVVDLTTPSSPEVLDNHYLGRAAPVDLRADVDIAYLLLPHEVFVVDLGPEPEPIYTLAGMEGAVSLERQGSLLALGGGDIRISRHPDGQTLDLRTKTIDQGLQDVVHHTDYSFTKAMFTYYYGELPIVYHILYVYDLTDPENPAVLVHCEVPSGDRLEKLGENLLLWGSESTDPLYILDISDPLTDIPILPVLLEGESVEAYDLAVVGTTVYLSLPEGLEVLDLSGEPSLMEEFSAIGGQDLQLAGDMLYIISGQQVRGFNLDDPLAPELLPPNRINLKFTPDAFLGFGEGWVIYRLGLEVGCLSVEGNGSLVATGSLSLNFPAVDAVVEGEILYVNTTWDNYINQIQVISLTEPTAPILFGVALVDHCQDISLATTGPVLCAGQNLLSLPRYCSSEPSAINDPISDLPSALGGPHLVGAAPSPFNPATNIHFYLDQSRKIRLSIFGIDGRLVVHLIDDVYPEGESQVLWRGRDRSGKPVASGVYFARLQTGQWTDSLKLLLVR